MTKITTITIIAVITALVSSCATQVGIPPKQPASGMAIIKGGNIVKGLISAQYTYVAGVDGKLYKRWSGSKQISPGRHRFAFAASHYAGAKSKIVMHFSVQQGEQYIVTADTDTWSLNPSGVVTYTVSRTRDKAVVATGTTTIIGIRNHEAGDQLRLEFQSLGWNN